MADLNLFSVFYLVGGSTNFVCQSLYGVFSFENAQKEVTALEKAGYKAISVKDGKTVGGYCSYTDFDNENDALKYYLSL